MKNKGAIIINNSYNEADVNIKDKISRLKEESSFYDISLDVIENNGNIALIDKGQIILN